MSPRIRARLLVAGRAALATAAGLGYSVCFFALGPFVAIIGLVLAAVLASVSRQPFQSAHGALTVGSYAAGYWGIVVRTSLNRHPTLGCEAAPLRADLIWFLVGLGGIVLAASMHVAIVYRRSA